MVQRIFKEIGINADRFNLRWASAAEAPRFVKLITEYTMRVKELGPLGEAEGIDPDKLRSRLRDALNLVSGRKLRVAFGNVTKTVRKEGKFVPEQIAGLIDEKLTNTMQAGLLEEGLQSALGQGGPANAASLASKLEAPLDQTEKILATLAKQGKIVQDGENFSVFG